MHESQATVDGKSRKKFYYFISPPGTKVIKPKYGTLFHNSQLAQLQHPHQGQIKLSAAVTHNNQTNLQSWEEERADNTLNTDMKQLQEQNHQWRKSPLQSAPSFLKFFDLRLHGTQQSIVIFSVWQQMSLLTSVWSDKLPILHMLIEEKDPGLTLLTTMTRTVFVPLITFFIYDTRVCFLQSISECIGFNGSSSMFQMCCLKAINNYCFTGYD